MTPIHLVSEFEYGRWPGTAELSQASPAEHTEYAEPDATQ